MPEAVKQKYSRLSHCRVTINMMLFALKTAECLSKSTLHRACVTVQEICKDYTPRPVSTFELHLTASLCLLTPRRRHHIPRTKDRKRLLEAAGVQAAKSKMSKSRVPGFGNGVRAFLKAAATKQTLPCVLTLPSRVPQHAGAHTEQPSHDPHKDQRLP